MQLGETRRRAVETSPGEDVRERRVRSLRARTGILRHVAERPPAQHKPAGGVVLTGQDPEQARLSPAAATYQAAFVPPADREPGLGPPATRGDADGPTPDLAHAGMLRAAPPDVLS